MKGISVWDGKTAPALQVWLNGFENLGAIFCRFVV
jgi:hypothetical protein